MKEPCKDGFMTIKQATRYAEFAHDIYTRQLLREGKFDEPVAPVKVEFKGYSRWEIAKASVDAYLASRSSRTTGRRFILKTDLENESLIRAALDELKIEYTLNLSYKPKGD